ncbi:MAG: amidohydrolase family protein, partial [Planctomycetes bacterium]|nr:amidohydrolase family protein [Planctomycetota bacterium]
LTMIVDGHTGIEHTFPVEIVYDDVLQMWKPEPGRGLASVGVGYTPTLSVAYGGLSGEYWWYQHDELWKHPRLRGFVPPEVVIPRARRRMMAPDEDYNHFLCARICEQAIGLGIPVQPGGHGQMQGINTHWEIWMMTHGGMSNLEALYCGTHNGARHLGLEGDLGSIEPGKLADLIVIERGKDPAKQIRDTEAIQWTIANGRVFDAKSMAERMSDGTLGPAPQFFWMAEGYSPSRVPPAVGGCHGCGHPNACGWMRQ